MLAGLLRASLSQRGAWQRNAQLTFWFGFRRGVAQRTIPEFTFPNGVVRGFLCFLTEYIFR